MESQVRQNYHRDCEAAINRMLNMELFASYTYTSMVRITLSVLEISINIGHRFSQFRVFMHSTVGLRC